MIFRVHIPLPPLSGFVENIIYYRDYQPVHDIDRFLPDGNIHLLFDLTEHPKYIYDNTSLKEIQSCRRVWFSGIRTEPISIPSGRDSEMVIVNFVKGRSYPFVPMPVNELTDCVVDGDLIFSPEIMNIREKLIGLVSIREKFGYIEKVLTAYLQKNFRENPLVEYSVNRIITSMGNSTIEEISRKVGYSQKHFIKLFAEHVGLTPKAFLRIIRFQKAIVEIEKSGLINWARLAFDCGYYDQAHFITDFKGFSGFTPGDYIKLKTDQLNYVPVR